MNNQAGVTTEEKAITVSNYCRTHACADCAMFGSRWCKGENRNETDAINEAFALLVEEYRTAPTSTAEDNDQVNHPSHYTTGKIECIDFIEDKELGYHLGNAVKYICRAGKKDPDKTVQDLEKAVWYLNRKIQSLKGGAT